MALTLEGVEVQRGAFRLRADLRVASGARVAVIGPSGEGKTTLLHLVAGFLAPDRGRVLWQGQDLAGASPGARPVTLLFQEHNLFPQLTVAANVGLGVRPDLRLSRGERASVEAALDRVGLGGRGADRPGALSGGQRSRAALARALLMDRPILALDEPFAALGPAMRREMLGLVSEIVAAAQMTLLMVSHQPEDATALAEQAVLVADGLAAAPVSVEALFAAPPPALRDYL